MYLNRSNKSLWIVIELLKQGYVIRKEFNHYYIDGFELSQKLVDYIKLSDHNFIW